MTTVPPPVGAATGPQGYGKAIVSGLVQPFAGALAVVVIAITESIIGHPLSSMLDGAVTTLIETPITILAVVYTPHNLFGGN